MPMDETTFYSNALPELEEAKLELEIALEDNANLDVESWIAEKHNHLASELQSYLRIYREVQAGLELFRTPIVAPQCSIIPPGPFAHFEIIEYISDGGQAQVYLAKQRSPQRTVALKVLKSANISLIGNILQFTEADHAASVEHPNIVPIYEVGEFEGQHYFSMKLLDDNLANCIADYQLPVRRQKKNRLGLIRNKQMILKQRRFKLIELMITVAQAVDFGHKRGILHRDLKPANILLDNERRPYVADFGLAVPIEVQMEETIEEDIEQVTPSDGVDVTRKTILKNKIIAGTIGYMSPEQARGDKHPLVGSDIFSLGIILYELLTSTRPFSGDTASEILHQTMECNIESPRFRNANVDVDLAAICMKCLKKNPRDRYSTALELAEDLKRYSRNYPVKARSVNVFGQLNKWTQRKPGLAIVSSMLIGLLALGITLNFYLLIELTNANESLLRTNFGNDMSQANSIVFGGDLVIGKDVLNRCPKDLREWPWHFLANTAQGNFDTYQGIHGAVTHFVRHPKSNDLVVASKHAVEYWVGDDYSEKKTLLKSQGETDLRVTDLAFLPTANFLVIAEEDGTVHILSLDNSLHIIQKNAGTTLAVSSQRPLLATADLRGEIKIWDLSNAKKIALVWSFNSNSSLVHKIQFVPNSTEIVIGGYAANSSVSFWDYAKRQECEEKRVFTGIPNYALAASSDGTRLALLHTSTAKTFSIVEGKLQQERLLPGRYKGQCKSLAYSTKSDYIAAGFQNGQVVVWSAASGQILYRVERSKNIIPNIAFDSDGRRLFYVLDGKIFVEHWQDHTGRAIHTFDPPAKKGKARKIAYSQDGDFVFQATDSGNIRIFDNRKRIWLDEELDHGSAVYDLAVLPKDPSYVVSASAAGTIKIWNTISWQEVKTLDAHKFVVTCIDFSSDGRFLLSGDERGNVYLWNTDTWTLTERIIESTSKSENLLGTTKIWDMDFSPNNRNFAIAVHTSTILFDLDDLANPVRISPHKSTVYSVRFSSTGEHLVTSSEDGQAAVIDLKTQRTIPLIHDDAIYIADFLPVSNANEIRVLLGGRNGVLQAYDPRIAHPIVNWKSDEKANPIVSLCVNPRNSRQIAVGYGNGLLRLFESSPGVE